MGIALGIALGLLVVAAVSCLVLWHQRSRFQEENANLREANQQLDTDLAVLRETQERVEEQFEQLRQQAHDTFKALAGDALKQSSEQFLQLATQRFNVEQTKAGEQLESRKQQIQALLQPVRETLDKYNISLNKVESARKEAYGSLNEQLRRMTEDQQRLRQETTNLVTALRRPEVRGRWGEMQLRRVAELAGMIDHCDFEEQPTVRGVDGLLRPDMIVHLPSERTIVVDAKTPLDAFLDSLDAPDEQAREAARSRHAEQVEGKVRQLAGKQYVQQFDRAPDFVVLFIPGEAFLQAAVAVKPNLIEEAIQKDVLVASPTILIALMRAVAVGWREERMAENAERISREGRVVHERLCTLAEHLADLGDTLTKAQEQYERFLRSFTTRALPSVRKLEALHAKSTKDVPEAIENVEAVSAEPQAMESADDDDELAS